MNSVDFTKIIQHFEKVSVLVIGDLMLDRYLCGTMSRISPEAPVPLIDITSENFRLGGAANAMNTIRSLGGKVVAAGIVGDDWFGKRLIGLLKQDNIDTSCVLEMKERPTTVKTRVMAGQYPVIRMDRESKIPIDEAYSKIILDFIASHIEQVDAILISDYNKGVVTNRLLRGSIDLAKTNDKPIILYPKIDPLLDYSGITTIITDREKATSITGIRQINETSIRNMGHWMLSHFRCESVLITREADGLSLFEKNDTVTHIPPMISEVRNLTGVVDAVASTVTLSLASGVSCMAESAYLGGAAAGIVASKRNATSVTRKELLDHTNLPNERRTDRTRTCH